MLHDLVAKFLSPASIKRALVSDAVDKIEVSEIILRMQKLKGQMFLSSFHETID